MRVPMTGRDFWDRGKFVHGGRVGVVDEPDPRGAARATETKSRLPRSMLPGVQLLGPWQRRTHCWSVRRQVTPLWQGLSPNNRAI